MQSQHAWNGINITQIKPQNNASGHARKIRRANQQRLKIGFDAIVKKGLEYFFKYSENCNQIVLIMCA